MAVRTVEITYVVTAIEMAASILVTPLWASQALEQRHRKAHWRDPLLKVEKEFRRIVGDADARRRGLPSNRSIKTLARVARVPDEEHRFADALNAVDLRTKAQRRLLCGSVGKAAVCTNSECEAKFFAPFGCNTRFCPRCGPRLAAKTFAKHRNRLYPVVKDLLRNPRNLLIKLDLTTINLGRMPTPAEIHEFEHCIKRFRKALLALLGLKTRDVGFGRALEFGGRNSNLHAHCLWVGPRLPRPKARGKKKLLLLSKMWMAACEGTTFHGSFIVSVKRAESFERALGHCLKYALKHVPSNPMRAAALEAAFNGVRRFQCAGAFFNVPESPGEKCHAERGCPYCESALQFSFCSCFPLPIAASWGFMNLGEARRAKALGMKPSAARAP